MEVGTPDEGVVIRFVALSDECISLYPYRT